MIQSIIIEAEIPLNLFFPRLGTQMQGKRYPSISRNLQLFGEDLGRLAVREQRLHLPIFHHALVSASVHLPREGWSRNVEISTSIERVVLGMRDAAFFTGSTVGPHLFYSQIADERGDPERLWVSLIVEEAPGQFFEDFVPKKHA